MTYRPLGADFGGASSNSGTSAITGGYNASTVNLPSHAAKNNPDSCVIGLFGDNAVCNSNEHQIVVNSKTGLTTILDRETADSQALKPNFTVLNGVLTETIQSGMPGVPDTYRSSKLPPHYEFKLSDGTEMAIDTRTDPATGKVLSDLTIVNVPSADEVAAGATGHGFGVVLKGIGSGEAFKKSDLSGTMGDGARLKAQMESNLSDTEGYFAAHPEFHQTFYYAQGKMQEVTVGSMFGGHGAQSVPSAIDPDTFAHDQTGDNHGHIGWKGSDPTLGAGQMTTYNKTIDGDRFYLGASSILVPCDTPAGAIPTAQPFASTVDNPSISSATATASSTNLNTGTPTATTTPGNSYPTLLPLTGTQFAPAAQDHSDGHKTDNSANDADALKKLLALLPTPPAATSAAGAPGATS